jgi:eukaryotic-like serine/threonine-protein kinase
VTRRRAPWWLYAVGVPFVIYAGVTVYACIFGPEQAGWVARFSQRSAVIEAVKANSPAARAGLEPGDRILSWDGLPVGRGQLAARLWHVEIGRAYTLEVQRGEVHREVPLSFNRRTWRYWGERQGQSELFTVFGGLVYLIVGFVIAFARPNDPVALWGALFLAVNFVGACDSARELLGVGRFHIYRELPMALAGPLVLLAALVRGSVASVCLTFLAVFPRRLFKARWIWGLIWLPALPFAAIFLYWNWLQVYSPETFPGLGWTAALAQGTTIAYLLAGPFFFFSNYRLSDANERRRLRVVATGFAVSVGVVLSTLTALTLVQFGEGLPRKIATAYASSPLFPAALLFYPAFGIAMAYAILRHRLFDIRIMVRQGLRYAAARGLLLSLVPLVGVVLVLDLLLHGNQPLMTILVRRGWFYAVLALGGVLAHTRQKSWLAALDRRFFRERYDAQRVLRGVVEEIRRAGSFEEAARRSVSQIETALHPESAALLVRQPSEVSYRVLATREHAPPSIPVDSKLMALVRLLGKPLEVSQSDAGWLQRQLPHEETDFLRQARLEWLYPISLATNRPEALLVLGPKLSEEPYSQEDQELIEGIVSSLALLLERSPATTVVQERVSALPEILGGRYRFERELGRGGMGAVWEAFDTELERRVAVKLILPELLASPDAVARFKREARAAAGLSHPNVVIVHDFGVAEDQRAYLVMELLHGRTLRHELHESGRLTPPRAVEILRGVCAAVDAAHRRRLLHRDLKPENIFLAKAGELEIPKILDFGVVKAIGLDERTLSEAGTQPGALVGTLKYMSPEQLRGESASERWDLWALAVVAYEMLAGAHPFAAGGRLEWERAILTARVAPLREHFPDAPATWETFFARALAADPTARPASASDLFAEFEIALQPTPQ